MNVETSSSSTSSITSQALIAEIAPAMRQKLRRDWRRKCSYLGMSMLLLGGFAVSHPKSDFGVVGYYAGFANLAFAALFLGFALFYPDGAVFEELKYRRVHGKWRWER